MAWTIRSGFRAAVRSSRRWLDSRCRRRASTPSRPVISARGRYAGTWTGAFASLPARSFLLRSDDAGAWRSSSRRASTSSKSPCPLVLSSTGSTCSTATARPRNTSASSRTRGSSSVTPQTTFVAVTPCVPRADFRIGFSAWHRCDARIRSSRWRLRPRHSHSRRATMR